MWKNADRTIHRTQFPTIRRGARWHRKVWILEQGYASVKAFGDHAGPAEMRLAVQYYAAWLRIASEFIIYHCEEHIPIDVKNHYIAAFRWMLEHEEANT